MTVLLQVSDPHFGTEQAPVVAALEHLARVQAPDVLVLSGDITQRATAAQFSAARTFVDRLGIAAVLAIPGNHDIPLFNAAARLLAPYARYERSFGADLEPVFASDELLILALNTTRWYRHVDGEVSPAQIERVARRLERAGERQMRIVVVHQPVAVSRAADEKNLLHGRDEAVRRWAHAGADLILGGHIHLPFIVPLHERMPDLPRRIWAVQAGTATSTRVRAGAGNSVNLLRIGERSSANGCSVERWNYGVAVQRFECARVDDLRLDPRPELRLDQRTRDAAGTPH